MQTKLRPHKAVKDHGKKFRTKPPTSFSRIVHYEYPGGTPILGHIRDVRPEWVSFSGQKPADGCKFLKKKTPPDGS